MIVYSQKIIRFVNDIKGIIKDVLSNEVRLRVERNRFYDPVQNFSYPIQVVVFNNKSMLGYFDPTFYELGFHECLMLANREQLQNVIRHELAHYITFIHYGGALPPHSSQFRAFCQKMGWGEEVYRASTCLEEGAEASHLQDSTLLRKVQKLMALASSANKNEAEQAMIKSQQLLLKHNVDARYVGGDGEEKVLLKRILKQKKVSSKVRAIAKILNTFFVTTVYNRGGDFTYLEILGSAVNVEIAEYVAGVLESELDHLWQQAQKQARLKGTIAKNSFFLGLAKGYCDKIEALKREYNSEVQSALMVIEKQLTDAQAMAYPHLRFTRSSGGYCQESSALGEQMGKHLNIHPAVCRASNPSEALIGYEQ
ncbi:MAG: DUF2786 domain-containing protein [Verrucomicrobia bacterium]|nr:DUF2786 domain-containing protein [Verrucomicrobiota bacterium]